MKKHLYFILFIAISLLGAQITHTGNKPWYMVDIKNMNSTYTKNCTKIGRIQSLRTIGTIAYNVITHDKNNPEQQLHEIEAQLKRFGAKLLTKEQEALLAIKNKFQIDQAQWNELLHTIETLKNVYQQGMQQEWSDVTHNVPENIKNILYDLMKRNNIHPQSINLTINPKKTSTTRAQAKTLLYTHTEPDLTFINDYTPHTIEFFPAVLNNSYKRTKATCAHEIEHLVQHHAITELVIKKYLKHYHQLSQDEIEKSDEFYTLNKIQEQQAEILSSIKDPEVAACMAHHRSTSHYDKYLHEKHYYHLTTIHMLWQLHAWVTFFHHGGIEKTTEEFKSKIEQSVSAFKNYCTYSTYT